LQTPEARELLGELAPGGALDPAAAQRTPYVEQLLRTLPVLTPETGAWLDRLGGRSPTGRRSCVKRAVLCRPKQCSPCQLPSYVLM